jgi:hypothetical protein
MRKTTFHKWKKSLFYDIGLTMSREQRAEGTSPSRIILVSLRPANSQKMKPKAQNQLGHFPRKPLMHYCGALNDGKSIYSESPVLQRLQHNTFDLRMVSNRNVLVYIHLCVMLSVALAIIFNISSMLFYSLRSSWTYSFLSYWILRLIAIDKTTDMISFLFRTSSIISSFGEFVHIWNINYLETSFVVFRRIQIDGTDYRIVFGFLISEYLIFELIIQNATIRK